jgi:hypothetical protein
MQVKSISVTVKPYSFFPCQTGDEHPIAVRTRCCIGDREWEWAETLNLTDSRDEIDALMEHIKTNLNQAITKANEATTP